MRITVRLAALCLFVCLLSPMHVLGADLFIFVHFGEDGPEDEFLAKVDPATGAVSIIGPTVLGPAPGLDFPPCEGLLFGASDGQLKTYDIATGQATLIGPLGSVGVGNGLAFSEDGRLFLANNDTDSLYEVNRTTGAATLIGGVGFDLTGSGMDFAPDGTLYLIESTTDSLYTVDTQTGDLTLVGSLGVDMQVSDLAITADGTFFASALISRDRSLMTINPDTGATTIIGPLEVPSEPTALVRTFSLGWGPDSRVCIDIKPGSDPNSLNCNNDQGVIPVAILTTDDFDATTVDHTTVMFEGASETHVNKKTDRPRRHEEDVDDDGDTDLVFHFRLGDTALDCDSIEGTLTREAFDGTPIVLTDSVRMVERGPKITTAGAPIRGPKK